KFIILTEQVLFCYKAKNVGILSASEAFKHSSRAKDAVINREIIICPLLSEISGKMRFVQSLFALVAVGLYGKCLQVSTINLLTRALFYGAKINIIIIN
ncbi:MAG: hypothetical protein AAGI49_20050, partial [Bacteroidota bacterium]